MLCSIIRRTIVLGSRNTQKLVSLLIRAMSFVINWMYSTHRLQSTQLPAPNPCSRAGRRHHPIFWFTQELWFVHRDQVNGGYRTYPRCLPRVHPAFQLLAVLRPRCCEGKGSDSRRLLFWRSRCVEWT